VFSGKPFMSGAAQPLGTLLFLETSAALDPSAAGGRLAALVNITVIRSGMISIDDMLRGGITPDLILHEQPFVEA
jgi:hypothetical protein